MDQQGASPSHAPGALVGGYERGSPHDVGE
jgi:hypothetical protein